VVKIADTEREKNAKRLHGTLNAVGGMNGVNSLSFNSLGVSPLQAAAYYQVEMCVCVCVRAWDLL